MLRRNIPLCFSLRRASLERERQRSYRHHVGEHPLVYRNVGEELQRAVSDFGSAEAIVSCHEGRRYTFGALVDDVDRVAAGLRRLGLERGDHVGLWGTNNVHWYLTMLGAARAGLVSVAINHAYQAPELEYCLRKVNVKAVVAPERYKTQHYAAMLERLCPELGSAVDGRLRCGRLPHLRAVIIDAPESSAPRGAITFDRLLDSSNGDEVNAIAAQLHRIGADEPCNVQFTSGTTGQPKAAVLSHCGLVNNGIHVGRRNELAGGQRICVQVPLFHVFGVVASIMAGMSYGATVVLPAAGFDAARSLAAIDGERCTVIYGTPTMYVDLVRAQRELRLPLDSVRMAVTGGASCPPQLYKDMREVLHADEVRNVFGLTESTAVIFQSRAGDCEADLLGTVGHLQDHVEAKVVDASGNVVPIGEAGELCVRGYCTMLGYHGDAERTRETIGPDRWLRTGDQFVLREDGYGRIVGRLKDMVVRGGENIFPKEIEDFLHAHPDIIEVHVIGVPDERLGEELCAFVRLRQGVQQLTRAHLSDFMRGRLAHFKVPRYCLCVQDFPKTASGKIQKFKLQEIAEKMLANNSSRRDDDDGRQC